MKEGIQYRVVVEVLDGPESVLGDKPNVVSAHYMTLYSENKDNHIRVSDLNHLVEHEEGFKPFGDPKGNSP